MINLFNCTDLDVALTFGVPMNPFTRTLDMPVQFLTLNSIVSCLQLHDSDEGLKTHIAQNSYASYSENCTNFQGNYMCSGDTFYYEVPYQSYDYSCSQICKNINKTEENLLNENTARSTEFKVSLPYCCNGNITVKDTEHSDMIEFYENSTENQDKELLISQYPHEVILKKNGEFGKTQKFYVCKYPGCCKEFTKSWNLIYHARIHTNEKPFKCTHCLESFAQKGNLNRHLKTHSETALCKRKKFQCNICLKKYTTKFNLKVHRQSRHKVCETN